VARFGTDGWSKPDITAGRRSTGTDQETDTRLLEYDLIMVVRISHCPACRVLRCIWRARCIVDAPAVAVRPHFKLIAVAGCHLDKTSADVEM